MFTFIVFLLLLVFCYFLYVYLTNQIVAQRKRIMLLINENNELKTKLNRMITSSASSKVNNPPPEEFLNEKINTSSDET